MHLFRLGTVVPLANLNRCNGFGNRHVGIRCGERGVRGSERIAFGFTTVFEAIVRLCGRALERTGEIFNEDPWQMMPADLAQAYQVEPPKKG